MSKLVETKFGSLGGRGWRGCPTPDRECGLARAPEVRERKHRPCYSVVMAAGGRWSLGIHLSASHHSFSGKDARAPIMRGQMSIDALGYNSYPHSRGAQQI